MDRIIIEGVRCFYEKQSVPLKPITLLVGENSSGKSTFLALVRAAWDISVAQSPNFNEAPFSLGAYDQIATFRAGRGGYAKKLTIGAEFAKSKDLGSSRIGPNRSDSLAIVGHFVSKNGQPVVVERTMNTGDFWVSISAVEDPLILNMATSSRSARVRLPFYLNIPSSKYPAGELALITLQSSFPDVPEQRYFEILDGDLSPKDVAEIANAFVNTGREFSGSRPYAFAPIRTHPQRTYDPIKDVPEPSGSHVPMILAQISLSSPSEWDYLRSALDKFGEATGLFRDVEIKRLDKKKGSSAFQVQIKVAGSAFNLVDVGYGVSQVLPIVADALRAEEGSAFLLQQPEAHLHPKAQAELGSFLAVLAKQQNKQFVIETHSDYLVDRIRTDVRDGKIASNDVVILYFERKNGEATIHPLELDDFGNILNAPREYRQFFLDEERKLLGIA